MKKYAAALFAIVALCFGVQAQADVKIGVVNFKHCVEKSKLGQQEKSGFESMKKQMSSALEKTDKELEDLAKKLEDQDYMDGLSPQAEEELKQKFQGLGQDFARCQNQYYQMLNQANLRLLQSLQVAVAKAAESVRQVKNLTMVLNQDAAFALTASLDLTQDVIQEMDRQFEVALQTQTNETPAAAGAGS